MEVTAKTAILGRRLLGATPATVSLPAVDRRGEKTK